MSILYTKYKTQCYWIIIPLLSVFSKIIERLTYNCLIEYLSKNNFVNKYQFGFQNNHSTAMELIVLFENLTEGLDKGDSYYHF